MTDELLTIPAAARYSCISETGLRSRIRSGRLALKGIGPVQTITVSRQALDALVLTWTSR